ncbi:MAG: TetR family transcriptional regulator [Actinobacteria bacterium]|nr:MAG: TetR family transcriptional regulator [Actinomycetota bacterium]
MKSQARAKRPYDASRRQEQARATRRAVVDAAARLFVREGYAGTSADEIAAKAGVCRATVFAVGGKGDLLKLAYDFAVGGDDEEIRLVERPRSREVRAAPDARSYLRGYAGLVTDIYVRLAALHEVVRAASHSDSEVGALWRKINADRRRGADTIVADLRAREPLRDGLDESSAADIVWTLNDAVHYDMLVNRRGWSKERFEEWLAGALERELLREKRRAR